MAGSSYKLHRRALGVLNELTPEEKAQVMEKLALLLKNPPGQWPTGQAKRFEGDQPLYLVWVNDSLRGIVRAAEGQQPEVMDLVRHETLQSFAQTAGNGGS